MGMKIEEAFAIFEEFGDALKERCDELREYEEEHDYEDTTAEGIIAELEVSLSHMLREAKRLRAEC